MSHVINQAISLLITYAIGITVICFIGVVAVSYLKAKGLFKKELEQKKTYIHLLTVVALGAWSTFIFATKFKFLSILAGGSALIGMFLIVKNTIPQQEPIGLKYERRKPYRKRYKAKFHLINKTETELMNLLLTAVPAYNVFPQVSMSQIFYLEPDTEDTEDKLKEIGKKSVDFVLCRKNDSSIVIAVEFNGPSHNDPAQQTSDRVKREALEEAGIPLLTYETNTFPDAETIKMDIATLVRERIKNEKEKKRRIQEYQASKQTN